jgi:hypothetical protein
MDNVVGVIRLAAVKIISRENIAWSGRRAKAIIEMPWGTRGHQCLGMVTSPGVQLAPPPHPNFILRGLPISSR